MFNWNKENLFNALQKRFPEALAEFCQWIDDYKNEVGWHDLCQYSTKFHDLPKEMQIGIIMRFSIEMAIKYDGEEKTFESDIQEMITAFIELMEALQIVKSANDKEK